MKIIRRTTSILLALIIALSTYTVKTNADSATEENAALARRIGAEGSVLLKNDNNALPLCKGEAIALFGNAQLDYVEGGGGSGVVYTSYSISPLEALETKDKEGKVKLCSSLAEKYRCAIDGFEDPKELKVTDAMIEEAKKDCSSAIYFISRSSTESMDRKAEKGDYYLSDDELDTLTRLRKSFKKLIVILNICGVMDTSWFKGDDQVLSPDSVLITWLGGMEGGSYIADILCGDSYPSGKLADTFASDHTDYLSSDKFNSLVNETYSEDIFVGYRQFETFDRSYSQVNYEFGFGLSYTTFSIEQAEAKISEDNKSIALSVSIKNTGTRPGKEVIQVYFGNPDGKLSKAGKELAAFVKTKELKADEACTVSLTFPISDMSSFDDTGKIQKSAYVLEAGDYPIYCGTSIKDATLRGSIFVYTQQENKVTEQLSSLCAPKSLKKRLLCSGEFESISKSTYKYEPKTVSFEKAEASSDITLADVYKDRTLLNKFICSLTEEELMSLCIGKSCRVGGSAGAIGLDLFEKRSMTLINVTDGPAGVRVTSLSTFWPCSTLLACTWNTDIARELGIAIAYEMLEANIDIWLAPGMNIHRNPLCGRNFEYYSEDPLLTGQMAAAVTVGVQSKNVGVTLKHFAANNKEYERSASNSIVSEKALREIYLKGFEICVKQAEPMCIMTSYNVLNGTETAENKELLTGILREEWGYKGLVMTDWGNNSRIEKEVYAGNNVKMPDGNINDIKAVYDKGEITLDMLRNNASYILNCILKCNSFISTVYPKKAVINHITTSHIGTRDIFYMHGSNVIVETNPNDASRSHFGFFYEGSTLYFKVNVIKDGIYDFSSLISSPDGSGSYSIYLDNKELYEFNNTTKTSSWYDFTEVDNSSVKLEKGIYTLKLTVNGDGINLEKIIIRPSVENYLWLIAGGTFITVVLAFVIFFLVKKYKVSTRSASLMKSRTLAHTVNQEV